MPNTASVPASGNQDIDGLLSGIRWQSGALSYSFPTSATAYSASYGSEPTTFSPLNIDQQSAVRSILGLFASVANLSFTETPETGTLRYAMSSAPTTAWAYFPSNDPQGAGGDVWLNKTSYNKPLLGTYAWLTIIHETGHALGLKHGHEADNGFPPLPANRDSLEYSVMTYRAYVGDPAQDGYAVETTSYPQTLMQDDIAALQYMYGANFNTNSGNTVYSWSPTTGQQFINGVAQTMPAGNHILMTVWDGGGADTYDFSNYTTNLTVNLAPGAWTTTSSAQLADLDYFPQSNRGQHIAAGNIANALLYNGDLRSLIENAVGGSGNDILIGNQADNVLSGGGGNDTFVATSGKDVLHGDGGYDVVTYQGPHTQYEMISYNGVTAVARLGFGAQKVDGIEEIKFADGRAQANHTALDYIASYPDLIVAYGPDAAAGFDHFVSSGWMEGRQASFDGLRYIASYADLIHGYGANEQAGALHYIGAGYDEGRHVSFDGLRYIASYGDLIQGYGADAETGVLHYINAGYDEGRHVSFDGLRYIASYGDLIQGYGADAETGVLHYIGAGYDEGRHADFDPQAYLANYADLQQAYGNDYEAATIHYIQHGFFEGRTWHHDALA